jgi:zinc protease
LPKTIHARGCILAVLLAFALTVHGLALRAAGITLTPQPIHSLKLANGLVALMVEDHSVPVVSLEVWYHVGSKNEQPGKTGYAHLFEHLMFDGTKNIDNDMFSDYIVRTGGVDNAYTNDDVTVFWETMPSNTLPVALWLEADRMRNLDINAKTFDKEREVVKEERRLRFDNQPYGNVIEILYQHAFTVHPYRHMTIGSMEDLDHASIKDIQSFYDTYYQPDNATLVIAGDFDPQEVGKDIQEDFAPIPASGLPQERHIPVEPPQTAPRVIKLNLDVALPAFVEGYHMPADGTPDAYPLRLASKILSDGNSSLIYQSLVYDKQIAVQADSNGNFTEDPNLFFVLAVMNPGHPPAEGESAMEQVLDRLRDRPVSGEELTKAKNQILRDFAVSRETTQSRCEQLGYAAVILKDPELLNTEVQRFMAVTPADIQRVARKYFVPENSTLVEVYPRASTGEAAKGGEGSER